MIGVLVGATVALHRALVLPHLPAYGSGADDAVFWGIVLAVCVGLLAIGVDIQYTYYTLGHRLAGAVVVLAMWKHMNATRSVYLPGSPSATSVWFQMLQDAIPDRELFQDSEKQYAQKEQLKQAQEFAAASQFLHHPNVELAVMIRYSILSYW